MEQSLSYHDSFEGPEKLLEMWFGPLDNVDGAGKLGLRKVERKVWDEMLSLVKCSVLNVLSNDYFDAYLLRLVTPQPHRPDDFTENLPLLQNY